MKPCLVSHIRSLKTAALTEEKTRLNKSPKQTGFHFLILCSACFNFSVEQFAQFKKGLRSNTCLGLDCCPVLSMSGAVSHQRGSPQMPGSWDNPRLLFLSRNRKWWDLFWWLLSEYKTGCLDSEFWVSWIKIYTNLLIHSIKLKKGGNNQKQRRNSLYGIKPLFLYPF